MPIAGLSLVLHFKRIQDGRMMTMTVFYIGGRPPALSIWPIMLFTYKSTKGCTYKSQMSATKLGNKRKDRMILKAKFGGYRTKNSSNQTRKLNYRNLLPSIPAIQHNVKLVRKSTKPKFTCQYLETQRSMQLFSPMFSSDSLYLKQNCIVMDIVSFKGETLTLYQV